MIRFTNRLWLIPSGKTTYLRNRYLVTEERRIMATPLPGSISETLSDFMAGGLMQLAFKATQKEIEKHAKIIQTRRSN